MGAALAGLAVLAVRAATRPQSVTVAAAHEAALRAEVRGPGSVESRYPVSIGSRITGTIERVLADVGDNVEQGQLLATLDRAELDARTESARRSVSAARKQVALADANLAKTRADRELARTNRKRSEGLAGAGLISQQTLDESRAGFAAAQATERAGSVAKDTRCSELGRLIAQERLA